MSVHLRRPGMGRHMADTELANADSAAAMVKHEGLWPKANGLSITAKIVTDDDGDDDDGDDVCDDDVVFVDDGRHV